MAPLTLSAECAKPRNSVSRAVDVKALPKGNTKCHEKALKTLSFLANR